MLCPLWSLLLHLWINSSRLNASPLKKSCFIETKVSIITTMENGPSSIDANHKSICSLLMTIWIFPFLRRQNKKTLWILQRHYQVIPHNLALMRCQGCLLSKCLVVMELLTIIRSQYWWMAATLITLSNYELLAFSPFIHHSLMLVMVGNGGVLNCHYVCSQVLLSI